MEENKHLKCESLHLHWREWKAFYALWWMLFASARCRLRASLQNTPIGKEKRETGFNLPSAHYSHITIIASTCLNTGPPVVLVLLKTKGIIATHKSHHTPAHLNEQRRICSIQSLDQYPDLTWIKYGTRPGDAKNKMFMCFALALLTELTQWAVKRPH